MAKYALLFLLMAASACSSPRRGAIEAEDAELQRQSSGTDALLIGVHALDERNVWASGTNGRFVWTDDGGETWNAGSVPGADSLQFRDVHAVSPDEAYLLSIGPGDDSRIYHTTDRGDTWQELFVSDRAETFFDCFAFWPDGEGIAFSDAVDGEFPIIRSSGGGAVWRYLEATPTAQPNEGGFAASGTCVVTLRDGAVLIGTGNADQPRVLRSRDRGEAWSASDVPIPGGEAAGIATLAFRDNVNGVALGGNIADPASRSPNAAVTSDGGRTWSPTERTPFSGAVYGSAYAPQSDVLVAVGPGGAAFSADDAATWTLLDSLTHWSVDFGGPSVGWMVGPEGRITKIRF